MCKDIENHVKVCPRRQYECPHCKERGEYQERTTTHLEECPKMKIPCPNDGCDEKIQRCEMSNHSQECLFESVPCKYIKLGCNEMIPRRDLVEHQNDTQQHLQLAIDTVNHQQMSINKLEEKLVQQQPIPMIFRVNNFDRLKSNSRPFYSPAFYSSPRGYKMCINVDCNGYDDGLGTHVSVFAYLMRGENDDHLPWPFNRTVTIELLNQLEDRSHHSDEVQFPSDHNASQRVANKERSITGYGTSCFIPHSALGYVAAKHCQYLKDDCLYFRVKVETKSTKPWLGL